MPRQDLDPTLHSERLFLHDLPFSTGAPSFADAHAYFHFGEIDIDASGMLSVRIVTTKGVTVFHARYAPEPQSADRAEWGTMKTLPMNRQPP